MRNTTHCIAEVEWLQYIMTFKIDNGSHKGYIIRCGNICKGLDPQEVALGKPDEISSDVISEMI